MLSPQNNDNPSSFVMADEHSPIISWLNVFRKLEIYMAAKTEHHHRYLDPICTVSIIQDSSCGINDPTNASTAIQQIKVAIEPQLVLITRTLTNEYFIVYPFSPNELFMGGPPLEGINRYLSPGSDGGRFTPTYDYINILVA